MGRHRCSASTTVPTLQTLRRIRARSEDRALGDAASEGAKTKGEQLWDWEWDWDFEGAGFIGSGIEIGEKIGERIPGYRGTAAFLTILRANLALTTSLHPPDSPSTTASTMSSLHSSTTLPDPSPLSTTPLTSSSTTSNNPPTPTTTPSHPSTNNDTNTASLPPLTILPATSSIHKHAALKLIADSLAQRRQAAAYIIVTSPAAAATSVACLAALWPLMYAGPASLPLLLTTFAGLLMVLLVVVRGLVAGYLELAERIDWAWLGADEVFVALWGREEVCVGAVVVRVERRGKRRRGVVRGWTVRLRERGRGVGRGLLEEVARVGRERGWEGVGVEEGGVYEERVLLPMFHKTFERKMERGRKLLEEVWVEQAGRKKSR